MPNPHTPKPVTFSSAVATFYEVENNWAPSQMIDGIFTGPPPGPGQDPTYGGVNGWSVYNYATGVSEGADALLTFASPLAAGEYKLTFTIYQNYYGNPGHILGDFSLDYTTAASPTLSSPQTPVSILSESSLNGTTFSLLSPGELLADTSHNSVGTDTYTITALIDSSSPITGIFLDAIKNAALPGGGPGAPSSSNGNFVVSEFTLEVARINGKSEGHAHIHSTASAPDAAASGLAQDDSHLPPNAWAANLLSGLPATDIFHFTAGSLPPQALDNASLQAHLSTEPSAASDAHLQSQLSALVAELPAEATDHMSTIHAHDWWLV